MKEIVAIIRMQKMNATKRALGDAGIPSITANAVMGRGRGKVDLALLKGAAEGYDEAIDRLGPGPKLFAKRMLTIVVPDRLVPSVVNTIVRVNKTGNPGDGKIFVLPLLDAVQVRTGKLGDEVLDVGNA